MTRRFFLLAFLGALFGHKCQRKEPPQILTPREVPNLRGYNAELIVINEWDRLPVWNEVNWHEEMERHVQEVHARQRAYLDALSR